MKNRGFTLAEMLGVITILAILGLLIFPAVDKSLKEGKEDLYKVQIDNILQGAKEWVAENVLIAPDKNGESKILTLYQLRQAGKIDMNLANPIDKKIFPNDLEIKITKTSSDYVSEIVPNTGDDTDLTKYSPDTPKLSLNGDTVIYL